MRNGIFLGAIVILTSGPALANGPLSPLDAIHRGSRTSGGSPTVRSPTRQPARNRIHLPGITDQPAATPHRLSDFMLRRQAEPSAPSKVIVNKGVADTRSPAPVKAAEPPVSSRPADESPGIASRILRAIFGD